MRLVLLAYRAGFSVNTSRMTMMYPAGLLRFLLGVAVTGDISCNVNIWLSLKGIEHDFPAGVYTSGAGFAWRVGDGNIVFVGSRGVLRRCEPRALAAQCGDVE